MKKSIKFTKQNLEKIQHTDKLQKYYSTNYPSLCLFVQPEPSLNKSYYAHWSVIRYKKDGFTEDTACFSTTELNKITKAKNKLKAAKNAQWCRSNMPFIASMFKDNDRITLNSVVSELVPKDPDFADGKVLEQTIKTRVRRKLENALSGKEETKDGYQSHGIAWEDGYNYWISRDHSSEGAAKVFIQRGKDFRRSK